MINTSFGNGYRLTTNAAYEEVLLQAARSVSNRFNAAVGGGGFWSGTTNAQDDLWLDSAMNMELLFRASALSQCVTNAVDAAQYWQAAHNLFNSLSSTNYLAQGTPSSGILLHGVGETPPLWDQELDVSLIYADYYFLEALKRYGQIYGQRTVSYIPETNFCGTDSFTYQMCDSAGETVTATVTMVVSPSATNGFAAEVSLAPGTRLPTVSFPTVPGLSYDVQYRDLLTEGPWSWLATNLAGTGAALSITDTNRPSQRFYRVAARLQ